MYVTMMMTDQIPLELPPLLNGDVTMMPHLVNGDGSQQVILVQVNPGETFTIRAEDGTLQCIQEVIEDNTGVRRVVVTPQSPDCYAPSYPSAISPTHHLPPYLAHHPHFLHNSHTPFYPPVSGPGDLPPQFFQHHLPPTLYGEQEIIPLYGMSSYITREDQYCKPQHKKLKDRQIDRQNRLNSPPSSLYKTYLGNCTTVYNGNGKTHNGAVCGGVSGGTGIKKTERRARSSPRSNEQDAQEYESETKKTPDILSGIEKLMVSSIQSRTALVTWSPPNGGFLSGDKHSNGLSYSCSYEVALSDKGRDGKYKIIYSGEELECHLKELRPAADYHVRVYTVNRSVKGTCSEPLGFTTLSCVPEPPFPPKLSHRTKSSLTLQWKAPVDNGSRITSYLLQWDEGKRNSAFRECYLGSQRHCKLTKLCPVMGYTFRVAARNDIGKSEYSQEVVYYTLGNIPQTPSAPKLTRAGITWITLQWMKPEGCSPEETISYTLEIQEENYGPFSDTTEITTAAGPPAQCKAPVLTFLSDTCVLIDWESPESNGADISGYRLQWAKEDEAPELVYIDTDTSFQMSDLSPATHYCCRLQAVNLSGVGSFSDLVSCRTPASVPDAVCNLYVMDGAHVETRTILSSVRLMLSWEEACNNGSEIISYNIDLGDISISVGNITSHVIEDLLPEASYQIRIQAVNEIGAGPFSHPINIKTSPLPPLPPRLECAAAGPQSLKLKWADSSTKAQASDDTTYILQIEDKNTRFIPIYRGPSHTYKVQRLTEFTCYSFRIQAVNDAGEGPFSDVCSFSTTKSVPPTIKAPRVAQLEGNTCEIAWEMVSPMKGDPVGYILQVQVGRDAEYKQV
ncbi:hypothetical protein FKM82_004167 [Ascaphus truei]